jgi:hypothetical protein
MQPGNLVIIVAAGRRRLVVEVAGDYTWNLEPPPLVVGNYQHQRRVRLRRDLDPNRLWVPKRVRTSLISVRSEAGSSQPRSERLLLPIAKA